MDYLEINRIFLKPILCHPCTMKNGALLCWNKPSLPGYIVNIKWSVAHAKRDSRSTNETYKQKMFIHYRITTSFSQYSADRRNLYPQNVTHELHWLSEGAGNVNYLTRWDVVNLALCNGDSLCPWRRAITDDMVSKMVQFSIDNNKIPWKIVHAVQWLLSGVASVLNSLGCCHFYSVASVHQMWLQFSHSTYVCRENKHTYTHTHSNRHTHACKFYLILLKSVYSTFAVHRD